MHYIVWGFGPECTGIAEWFTEVTYHLDQKFGGRLRMDRQTGSLTIRNVRTTDSGLYQRDIIYYNPFLQETVLFNVTVYDAVKTVLLTEGDSVTLHINVTDIHRQDIRYIQWRIEPENTLLDIIFDNGTSDIIYYHDEIFRNRLQMDTQTGSLTIRNIRTTDSGLYALQFIRLVKSLSVLFNITVFASLPIPVIIRGSTQCPCPSSSSGSLVSRCSLLCSVLNVSHVTLSWYKGNSVLSSISVSDLSISLSLPLEVEYQEKNTYSCKVNNPISDQSTHLNITEHCQLCPDSVHCCGFTEAVIRLVLSGVVGVATVIMVVYDIRFRRAEKKRRTQSQSVVE
uniref:Ig-like domain-containing protein n=2 Tax=Cyprinus carpio TaxID=7962 RepID=A0A8C1TCV0_CYPCA